MVRKKIGLKMLKHKVEDSQMAAPLTPEILVIKNNGTLANYSELKIYEAILNAFCDQEGSAAASSHRVKDKVLMLAQKVHEKVVRWTRNHSYIKEPSGFKLDKTYKLAWIRGLKTTYYLRSLGATSNENSSEDKPSQIAQACGITVNECEVCQ